MFIVTEVLNRDATAQHLNDVFDDLAEKIRPRDVFVFYAAGHGITQDGRYYFIPHDWNLRLNGRIPNVPSVRIVCRHGSPKFSPRRAL